MKRLALLSILIIVLPISRADVSTEELIKSIDSKWERILLNSDLEALKEAIHPEFVWIHNHVTSIEEGKAAIVDKFEKKILSTKEKFPEIDFPDGMILGPQEGAARTQRDVKVVVSGNTALIYGYTDKDLSNYTMKTKGIKERRVVYNFMRTYVQENGEWLLIGNHTMQIPQDDAE